MPANPIPLTVSQEAREAAADLAEEQLGWEGRFVTELRAGLADRDAIVQAFARFEADCAARFVERVAEVRAKWRDDTPMCSGARMAIDEAIAAIQEPCP